MIPCRVFIYALCDPDTGVCRYVGKTSDLRRRYRTHLKDSICKKSNGYNTHVCRWLRRLHDQCKKPRLSVLEWVFLSAWGTYEKWWINFFRQSGVPLTNTSEGGIDGWGKCRRGIRMPESQRIALSVARKGIKTGPRGPFSEKARKAISEGLKRNGIKPPPHAYEKALKVNRGRVAWNRGQKMSPETCAKLSAMRIGNPSRTGMKDNPETLERKRQAQLRRWAKPEQRELAAQASRKSWGKRRANE